MTTYIYLHWHLHFCSFLFYNSCSLAGLRYSEILHKIVAFAFGSTLLGHRNFPLSSFYPQMSQWITQSVRREMTQVRSSPHNIQWRDRLTWSLPKFLIQGDFVSFRIRPSYALAAVTSGVTSFSCSALLTAPRGLTFNRDIKKSHEKEASLCRRSQVNDDIETTMSMCRNDRQISSWLKWF